LNEPAELRSDTIPTIPCRLPVPPSRSCPARALRFFSHCPAGVTRVQALHAVFGRRAGRCPCVQSLAASPPSCMAAPGLAPVIGGLSISSGAGLRARGLHSPLGAARARFAAPVALARAADRRPAVAGPAWPCSAPGGVGAQQAGLGLFPARHAPPALARPLHPGLPLGPPCPPSSRRSRAAPVAPRLQPPLLGGPSRMWRFAPGASRLPHLPPPSYTRGPRRSRPRPALALLATLQAPDVHAALACPSGRLPTAPAGARCPFAPGPAWRRPLRAHVRRSVPLGACRRIAACRPAALAGWRVCPVAAPPHSLSLCPPLAPPVRARAAPGWRRWRGLLPGSSPFVFPLPPRSRARSLAHPRGPGCCSTPRPPGAHSAGRATPLGCRVGLPRVAGPLGLGVPLPALPCVPVGPVPAMAPLVACAPFSCCGGPLRLFRRLFSGPGCGVCPGAGQLAFLPGSGRSGPGPLPLGSPFALRPGLSLPARLRRAGRRTGLSSRSHPPGGASARARLVAPRQAHLFRWRLTRLPLGPAARHWLARPVPPPFPCSLFFGRRVSPPCLPAVLATPDPAKANLTPPPPPALRPPSPSPLCRPPARRPHSPARPLSLLRRRSVRICVAASDSTSLADRAAPAVLPAARARARGRLNTVLFTSSRHHPRCHPFLWLVALPASPTPRLTPAPAFVGRILTPCACARLAGTNCALPPHP